MKTITIFKLAVLVLMMQASISKNTFASTREITFTNNTGQAVDDLHIEFQGKVMDWDDTKPHTFNSDRHDAGSNKHNFYGTSIANGGSATMTFKNTSGDIVVNRWWWTSGGSNVADGQRVGELKSDNNTNNLSFSGGPATGNGMIGVFGMGIFQIFNTSPGYSPAQTCTSFINFIQANFNFGGITRVFLNQNGSSQVCCVGNTLGNPSDEIQFQMISMDFTQPVQLLQSSGRQLNLTAMIEGLYNPVTNKETMDYTTVLLRSTSSPYNIVDYMGTSLDSLGKGSYFFYAAQNNVPYYIVVNHRNGIETWSYDGLNRFISNQMTYDFTTSSSKAYGNNLKQIGTKYCIYNGDAQKNGIVDAGDLSMIDNDASNFLFGYYNSDLNNDLIVDASDYSLADNNASNFVTLARP